VRVIQLNADEGMLFWVGKGGRRKVVELAHVDRIEAADSDGDTVSSPLIVLLPLPLPLPLLLSLSCERLIYFFYWNSPPSLHAGNINV
jgi:hypothetical protein